MTTIERQEVWNLLREAHRVGARRQCASTISLLNSYQATQDSTKAITAAIACLGGKHAPIPEIMAFWHNVFHSGNPEMVLAQSLRHDPMVPGFGNSFVKGWDEEQLGELRRVMCVVMKNEMAMLRRLEHHVKEYKPIWPNLGMFTAIVFTERGIPLRHAMGYTVLLRIEAWMELLKNYEQKNLPWSMDGGEKSSS